MCECRVLSLVRYKSGIDNRIPSIFIWAGATGMNDDIKFIYRAILNFGRKVDSWEEVEAWDPGHDGSYYTMTFVGAVTRYHARLG